MGREYTSVVEAIAAGSACNFQLQIDIPSLPTPGVPSIPIPDFPPSLPSISLYCPMDEEPEERLE